jgi:hypothetical protein
LSLTRTSPPRERAREHHIVAYRVVDRFAELGLTCVVDLLHYGTPLWFDSQFLNTSYPARSFGVARGNAAGAATSQAGPVAHTEGR